MKIQTAKAYSVRIFICGDYQAAKKAMQKYVDEHPLCVTVTPTCYVFTGGQEDGVIVELINYVRFDSPHILIWDRARDVGEYLKIMLNQQSYTVQDHETTYWVSHRPEDNE